MSVDGRRQWAHVPGEPLRQEQVPRRPVDVRDGRVTQRVEPVNPVEPRPSLPRRPSVLDATLGDPTTGLAHEQGRSGREILAALTLPPRVPPELRDEPVREEHVRRPATLRDLPTDAHADPWGPVWSEDVAHVEADDFGEAQAGAEGEGVDEVVADVAGGRAKNDALFVDRQRSRGSSNVSVRCPGSRATAVPMASNISGARTA